MRTQKRNVRVVFEDGNYIDTTINGTKKEIKDYYLNNYFNFGDTEETPHDIMLKGVKVEFADIAS